MASESKMNTPERKLQYAERLNAFLDEHSKFVTIVVDNIGSNSLNLKRANFRRLGISMLKGKNTLTRKILALRAERLENAGKTEAANRTRQLIHLASGNMAFLFLPKETNIAKLCDSITKDTTVSPAKAGSTAPCDVTVQPRPTQLQPGMTSTLSAMGFSTRINRGQIDITAERELIKAGDKVSKTAAEVLKLLNIKPFKYGIKVETVHDEGLTFPSSLYGETRDAIKEAYANLLSLGLVIPSLSWPQLDRIRDQIENPAPEPVLCIYAKDPENMDDDVETESESDDNPGPFQFSDDSSEDSEPESESSDEES
jgi:large subunit ribosomal protein LP0